MVRNISHFLTRFKREKRPPVFCNECRWRYRFHGLEWYICKNPKYTKESIDYVTGRKGEKNPTCSDLNSIGQCKGFEVKE